MSEWDVIEDDDQFLDDIAQLRRPITGRRLGMPSNCLSGLRL